MSEFLLELSPSTGNRRCLRFLLLALAVTIAVEWGASVKAADLYVSYFYENTVHKFGPAGNDLGVFVGTGGPYQNGIAFDSRRNLYVVSYDATVLRFGPTGSPNGILSSPEMTYPWGIAVDRFDNVFVATSNTVHKFSPDGADLGIFGALDNGTLTDGLAFDSSGNLYVAARGSTRRIVKFSPSGTNLGTFATTGTDGPNGLVFDRFGNLYASYYSNSTIHKFGPDGTDLGIFASRGLNHPRGMAFDDAGNLYVANTSGYSGPYESSIHKFGPDGQDLGTFINTGPGTAPEWLAFAPVAQVPEPHSLLLIGAAIVIAVPKFRRWRFASTSQASA